VGYVEVRRDPDRFWHDATRYLEALRGSAEELPPGARAWATDPQHYDFSSTRCAKDLSLAALDVRPEFMLRLGPNAWQHEHGLEFGYHGVASFGFDLRQPSGSPPPASTSTSCCRTHSAVSTTWRSMAVISM